MADKASNVPLERALERIEALVAEMESGKLPLEEILSKFEEGSKLVKLCQERLEAAEKKIEIILREAGTPAGVTSFETEAE